MTELQRDPPQYVPALTAYLASALTGLSTTERPLVFDISTVVVNTCAKFNIEVYEPRKDYDPIEQPDVLDTIVFQNDRSRLLNSDLVILLAHYTSFGAGEEIAFAFGALMPIIIISPDQTNVSRMVTGTPTSKWLINYKEIRDLEENLQHCLVKVRPLLERRRRDFAAYRSNTVANNIRQLRERHNLTREQVAQRSQFLTEEALRMMEESPDYISNPSLIQLRHLASVLKVTVGELLEEV